MRLRQAETREETGLEIEVGELLARGEWLHRTHDLLAVFRARADRDPRPQAGKVVVECPGSRRTRRMC